MYDDNLPPALQSKGVLLDANLLIALLVGSFGEGEVERFKRTQQFATRDVVELTKVVERFGWRYTTPHVIAETSNLLDWMDDSRRCEAGKRLAAYICTAREVHVEGAEIVKTPVYHKLGITDAGLCLLARQSDCIVITADLPLYHYALNLHVQIVNFNHMRNQWI
ncbi:hypothetical protein H206_00307 [Candidatus Electrothrix aarhusensis]|jgi:predicted nucleic acid-binding protein|uniref:PIN domain-containing protein n=1 Tax=Candidatus Electrothrix aarhusensis TaxID=1859131 RepID=A0A444J094_9BACT|nr:hypothetical protein H206_00307 [Candidatus Electrothrix aarhusensis]